MLLDTSATLPLRSITACIMLLFADLLLAVSRFDNPANTAVFYVGMYDPEPELRSNLFVT